MNIMTEWLLPFRVRQSAMHNETGPAGLVDAKIAGFVYAPARPIELIVAKDTHRFYDVPLRFSGKDGGAQYALPSTWEAPTFAHEPRPRRVTACALPFGAARTGDCHGALTWNAANITLLVVVLDTGEVILWPPHKIEWTDKPVGFPSWLKRRYADDGPALDKTIVSEVEDAEMVEMTAIAKAALNKPLTSWRTHGLGLLQCYLPGPTKGGQIDPKRYRVHIWTKDAMMVGLEGGIHNHRYDFRSVIVAGVLTQEEWAARRDPEGMWHAWFHNNDTHAPVLTFARYSLTPRTLDLRCGQAYTFPRDGFHRSVPRSEVAVTVMERFDVDGVSCALCPTGVTPTNGQAMRVVDAGAHLALARKHLGLRA